MIFREFYTYCDVIIRHEVLIVLKKRKICHVELHGESENQIRFRIAFSVLPGIHFEQHAVFTIFGNFWPLLAKIAPLMLQQFK